jgi:hypothetical protein
MIRPVPAAEAGIFIELFLLQGKSKQRQETISQKLNK